MNKLYADYTTAQLAFVLRTITPTPELCAAVADRLEAIDSDARRYRYVRDELSPEDFATIPAEDLDHFVDRQISEAEA